MTEIETVFALVVGVDKTGLIGYEMEVIRGKADLEYMREQLLKLLVDFDRLENPTHQ